MKEKIYTHVDDVKGIISVSVPEGWYVDVQGDLDTPLNVVGISESRCIVRTKTATNSYTPKPKQPLIRTHRNQI